MRNSDILISTSGQQSRPINIFWIVPILDVGLLNWKCAYGRIANQCANCIELDIEGTRGITKQYKRKSSRGHRIHFSADVNPQHQHSGRLQHISYAEALRKYAVLDSGDKSGSAAAVPQGVSIGQAGSMSPGAESLAGAKEAS
ncbi:hypothetical protein J6590_044444 [Homalodisca vitripennis]|nr:hypothetical protein J6590_044444 [Homalodisca vitripennis]